MPFVWMLGTSLTPAAEMIRVDRPILPRHPAWENYRVALTVMPFYLFLKNTLVVALLCVIGQTTSAALVAFALGCDLVYASENAYFAQTFLEIGLIPDLGGAFTLPRLVGPMRAKEMALLGERVPAARALALGLINDVFPAERLLAEAAADPAVKGRIAAAYLIETVAPASDTPLPPCRIRREAGCLAAWVSVPEGQFQRARILLDRALVWGPGGELVNLEDRPALCFNPLLGATTGEPAPARLNLGAANATGLEWGARPGFMARQVSARCQDGVLFVTRPKSKSLVRDGAWADRRRAPGFNLFWANLEADAQVRVATMLARDASVSPHP